MNSAIRPFFLSVLSLSGAISLAQPGSVDLAFNPIDLTGGEAHGLNGSCRAVAVQPDGKILVAGGFSICNGVDRMRIARLNADGSLDETFDPGYGANDEVRAVAVQPDGKVLVGGQFTYFNGALCNHLVRLHPDGSLDETFNTGSGFDQPVNALAVQPDGRVIVGGDFYYFDGSVGHGLVRLTAEGHQDPGFAPGNVGYVYSLLLRADGRVLVGGCFSSIAGVDRYGLASLYPDGSLDASFAPVGWYAGAVYSLALQADGKVLAAGIIPGCIARLNTDGSADEDYGGSLTGFTGGMDPRVYSLALCADGSVIAAGEFMFYNGAACNNIARLLNDGTMDDGFLTGEGFNGDVYAVALQPDGKLLTGGGFASVDGTPRNRIARLMTEELSTGYSAYDKAELEMFPNPSSGLAWLRTATNGPATITILGPDGRLLQQQAQTALGAQVNELDLSLEPKGVYVVRITAGVEVHAQRLVIQ